MANYKVLGLLALVLSMLGIPMVSAQAVNFNCQAATSSGFQPVSCSSSFLGTQAGIDQNTQVGAGILSNTGLNLLQVFEAVVMIAIVGALFQKFGILKFLFGG